MTFKAIRPEKYHPAWGTIPPTPPFRSHGIDDFEYSSIARRHSASAPGYQLPAKSAFLTAVMITSFWKEDYILKLNAEI
jgi:hypothetical protein